MKDEPGAQDHRPFEDEDVEEAAVDLRRQGREPPHGERLPEARAQVVATRDALLEDGGVIGPRGLLDHLALGDRGEQAADRPERGDREQREHDDRGPPRRGGDDEHRDDRDDRAEHHPHLETHERADLTAVVVDAVEHLAHRLLGERGQRLPEGGVEEVLAQGALGAVRDPGPEETAEGVEHGAADDARGEHTDERPRDPFGEAPRDDRAQGCAHRAEREGEQRRPRGDGGEAPPRHGAGRCGGP